LVSECALEIPQVKFVSAKTAWFNGCPPLTEPEDWALGEHSLGLVSWEY